MRCLLRIAALGLVPVALLACAGNRRESAVRASPQGRGPGQPSVEARMFKNPIIPGSYPDPSICRVGDDYYLVHSSFEYFPGVPIFHSRDLVHWRQIGHVLTRRSQLPLEKVRASGGIYAPTLRHRDGMYYMVTTNVDGGGNFYVTAKHPAGPWSEPVWLDRGGIDPSLFFDDDGTVYYTRHEGMGDGYIAQTRLNLETGKLEGELRNIWGGTGGIWAEGPHLYKIDGIYYLMISEGGTSYDHSVTVARSQSPWGPFEPNPENPILTHRHLGDHPFQATGHADLVETPDGWWMVFLGIRPQPAGSRFHHTGRETFLAPVTFEAGWPVVHHGRPVDPLMAAPRLAPHPWPEPTSREAFDRDALSFDWNYLRNPREADYSLTARPGSLRLMGSAVTLRDQDAPTFVGRRQTSIAATVRTRLDFEPASENEEAGLVVRANDRHHYQIGVTRRQGRKQVFFRPVIGGNVVEPMTYADIPRGPAILSVTAAPSSYEFAYTASEQEAPIRLGAGSTRALSVEAIGFEHGMCFTGVYVGLYASGNGKPSTVPADFDWFEYRAGGE